VEDGVMGEGSKKAEIYCPVCGKVTFVVRRPVFEGLKKVGEKLVCSTCGTDFEDEAKVEFVERGKVEVFTDEDGVRLCMNCQHYVVNPFIQRCMLSMDEVEATDTCKHFVRRPEQKKEEEKEDKGPHALKKLFGESEDKGQPEKP
jgi:hypothetical protein